MPKFTTKLRRRQLDETLARLKNISRPPRGYIREIRDALEMSSYQLADRTGLSQSTVMNLEENEREGSITLRSLERMAASLGCKLVYALVPETSLEDTVTKQARRQAQKMSETISRTMALERQSTASEEHEALLKELADDVLRKGKRELWKHDKW